MEPKAFKQIPTPPGFEALSNSDPSGVTWTALLPVATENLEIGISQAEMFRSLQQWVREQESAANGPKR